MNRMRLGPEVPEWVELRRQLTRLATDTRALYAYVLDNRGRIWCTSESVDWDGQSPATSLVLRELAKLSKPLHRGGRLDRFIGRSDNAYARSFGGLYVLLLRFTALRDAIAVRAEVASALPRIEALVAGLPPPDGPGTEGAEGVGVA